MTMKKIFRICAALAVVCAVAGCYNDFDTPAPAKVYADEDFAELEHLSIAGLKQLFLAEHGDISGTGSNTSWEDTKFTQVGQSATGKDYYIKGKVMSNDEQGNVYKSLHLVDDTGAIEVKLTTGIYFTYPMGEFDRATGTIPTHWVYVKVTGLYVGNYRMMLSVGEGPTESYNKVGEHKFYANSNIENPTEIARRVFLGGDAELKLGEEILEIDETNYSQYFGKDAPAEALGKLALIKGVTCRYWDIGSNLYPSWMSTDVRPVISKRWYKWGFSEVNPKTKVTNNLYASVLFSYLDAAPSQTLKAGVYVIRSSGYSRFSKKPILKDGAKGDILAIYGIYSKSWTYSFGAYQCTINRFEDLMFDEDQFLSEDEVMAMTPNGYPNNDPSQGEYKEENDSWVTPDTSDDQYE